MPTVRRYLEVGRDVARDAVTWRPGRQTSEATYLAVRRMHARTSGLSSRAAFAVLSTLHDRGARDAAVPPAWEPALLGLRHDGVTLAPPALDPDAVARVMAFARTAPASLRSVENGSARGTFESRADDTASVHIVERFVLDQPDIQSLIAHPAVLALARAYFGATPVIHPPSLYWTCGGVLLPEERRLATARAFHWDYDGLRGLRLHLYLTDVDEDAAPMSYVRGSHTRRGLSTPAFRAADRGVPDDEVWRVFPRSALWTVTGPAGTTFLSDSQGLHRGSDATKRDRLFLVMPMQAMGFAGYHLRPRSVEPKDPGFASALGRPELALFRPRS